MTTASSLPTITVITVVYNSAVLLERTIESVIGQRYSNLRYIVIDGGSTDGTLDVISRYEDQISCWISEADRGIYDAMNKGWALADPESFILYLGAGDRLLSLPQDMDAYGSRSVLYGRVHLGDSLLFTPAAGFRLKLYNSLHHQALLVPKALHPAPPFDTSYQVYADFDFNQRLCRLGARFVYCPTLLSYAHPGGVSDGTRLAELRAIIRKNFGFWHATLALVCFKAAALLPFLKRLRPITGETIKSVDGNK